MVAALLTAAGWAVLALGPSGAPPARAEFALLAETALALAVFDARTLLIPDLYSAAVALAGCVGPLSAGWPTALAGAGVGAVMLAAVRWAVGRAVGREAMGWGDVKLAAALGALLGPLGLLWTVAAAATAGAAAALLLRRGGAPARIPFGAFLAPAGLAVAWAGRL